MYEILANELTVQNFGEWSKAYVNKLNESLQSKFNTAVEVNAGILATDAQMAAQSKINSASQDAQMAYNDAVAYKKKIQKIFIFSAVGVFVYLMFTGKVKL